VLHQRVLSMQLGHLSLHICIRKTLLLRLRLRLEGSLQFSATAHWQVELP
jgi:hypothetical protein